MNNAREIMGRLPTPWSWTRSTGLSGGKCLVIHNEDDDNYAVIVYQGGDKQGDILSSRDKNRKWTHKPCRK